mmetsp:Transcript_22336/g.35880  ORF Transcript_22336/g.35880 Transcript_22336/m.35880 type:complete len:368 (-) Transcript_22336:232-1335(-)
MKSETKIKILRTKMKSARAAWRKDKLNLKLKKEFKIMKQELLQAKMAIEMKKGGTSSNGHKSVSGDVEQHSSSCKQNFVSKSKNTIIKKLRIKMKEARAAWRENKKDRTLKKKFKKAKLALQQAKGEPNVKKDSVKKLNKMTNEKSSDHLAADRKGGDSSMDIPSVSNQPSAASEVENPKTKQDPEAATTTNDAKRKVFVSNLNFKVDEAAIKKLFSECGKVTEVTWLEEEKKGSKVFMGCAYVTFTTLAGARKAVQRGEVHHMKRDVRVEYSRDRTKMMSEVVEGATSCFVGNLPFELDEKDLEAWAGGSAAGVKKIFLLKDRKTKKQKGCGFVEFHNTENLRKFVLKNGSFFKGRKIRLRPKNHV